MPSPLTARTLHHVTLPAALLSFTRAGAASRA
jgi:hypothetical protein